MEHQDIEGIKEALKNMGTDELLDIWRKNDRQEWRDEAFVAIRELLLFRKAEIPDQETHIPDQSRQDKMSARKKEIMRGVALIASGMVITLLSLRTGVYVLIPTGLVVAGLYLVFRQHGKMK